VVSADKKHILVYFIKILMSSFTIKGNSNIYEITTDKKVFFFFEPDCLVSNKPGVTSTYQPTNAHIISYKTLLKHFKTFRHISILSDHHQGALFLAKVILQYSQFNSYLQTKCCGRTQPTVLSYLEAFRRCRRPEGKPS